MDSIEIKIGNHPVVFGKQSVTFSGTEYFYGKMTNVVQKKEPIPCYEFMYNGQKEALYYNLKTEKVVSSVFNQIIALNAQKEAAAAALAEAEQPQDQEVQEVQEVQETPETPEIKEDKEDNTVSKQEIPENDTAAVKQAPPVPEGFPDQETSSPEYLISEEHLEKPEPSKKKGIIIAVVIVVVIAAIAAGIFLKQRYEAKAPVPTVPNQAEVPKEDGVYEGGTYLVGVDLPQGVYLIEGSGYLAVSTDSAASLENMITNSNYTNRTFIQVQNQQYLTFEGKAQMADKAPTYEATEKLTDGMYLVGKDLPAGEYKLNATGDAYVAVMSDAKGIIDSIISNSSFSDSETITVEDGQFVELKNCTLDLEE